MRMHIIKSLKFKKAVTPWLFVLPGLVFAFIFRYYLMAQTFWISLHNYNITKPPGDFVGLRNYIWMFENPDFWAAWKNTFIFTGLYVLLIFPIPVLQAISLYAIKRGKGILSTLYLIPALIPFSVVVAIWRWIWNPQNFGIANQLMSLLGLPSQQWFSNPDLTKLCIVLTGVFGGGFSVLLYYSAIQGISKDVFEAAQIDGCGGFKNIFYIILPNIKFIIFIQLILSVSGYMQILDAPFQYTRGGPNGASTSIALFAYNQITNGRVVYGGAMAASMTLGIVILIITIIQLILNKSERE
jgi:multiple sugar transport system permease protein